jgi:hypothetical protein
MTKLIPFIALLAFLLLPTAIEAAEPCIPMFSHCAPAPAVPPVGTPDPDFCSRPAIQCGPDVPGAPPLPILSPPITDPECAPPGQGDGCSEPFRGGDPAWRPDYGDAVPSCGIPAPGHPCYEAQATVSVATLSFSERASHSEPTPKMYPIKLRKVR